jgi:hypothetical protein
VRSAWALEWTRFLFFLSLVVLSAGATNAQSGPAQGRPTATAERPEQDPPSAAEQAPVRIRPDNPIPVQPNLLDGPAPCPAGEGKSCALLGGRIYFSDPMRMTQHNKSLWQAATSPGMLIAFSFNAAATVADAESTQACLRAQTCVEGNPIFGAKPSRAKAYAIGTPIVLGTYLSAAFLKKQGKGNWAFALLWADTALHTFFAAKALSFVNAPPAAADSQDHHNARVSISF